MDLPVVIIPTYNERENIVSLVETLLSTHQGLRILIVDDNSPDGTGDLIRGLCRSDQRVSSLHRPRKMGLGSAYVQGMKMVLKRGGASYICTMDADLSHDPAHIPALLEAARESDVVVGSRYFKGVSVVNWPIARVALSYTANAYARFVTGLPLTDCTSGFCCYNVNVIRKLELDSIKSEGYAFLVEIKYRARDLGFTLTEVPIIFHERRRGSSKISKRIILEAAVMVWRLRLGI